MWNDNSFAFEETPCKFLKKRQYKLEELRHGFNELKNVA